MNTAEISRLIENLIKVGEVAETDPAAGLVRVKIGELRTDWRPYFVPAAGGVSVHRPPSAGEICIVLSPSGDTAQGMVLCGLAGHAHPQPSQSAGETVTVYPDGAIVKYNHQSSALEIAGIKTGKIQAAESLLIECPQTTTTGALIVEGLFTYKAGLSGAGGGAGTVIKGTVDHEGDFVNKGRLESNGVVVDTHAHGGVLPGGANTGEPVK